MKNSGGVQYSVVIFLEKQKHAISPQDAQPFLKEDTVEVMRIVPGYDQVPHQAKQHKFINLGRIQDFFDLLMGVATLVGSVFGHFNKTLSSFTKGAERWVKGDWLFDLKVDVAVGEGNEEGVVADGLELDVADGVGDADPTIDGKVVLEGQLVVLVHVCENFLFHCCDGSSLLLGG